MSFFPIVIGLVGAASMSTAVVYVVRLVAPRVGLIDIPNERSLHSTPVGRGGGIAIVLVSLLGLGATALIGLHADFAAELGYVAGAFLVAVVSFLDDLRALPARARFVIQILGAVAVVGGLASSTASLGVLGGQVPTVAIAGALLGVLWCVGLTNAYNFMDGIDGLAALQGVVIGLAWAALAFLSQQEWLAVFALLIVGGCLGFAFHNWPPARIFMGDVGSAFLGLTFAFFAMALPHTPYQLGSGVLILWLLLFDAGFTLLRRLLSGQNIFVAHRSHLYQRLVLSGWRQKRVTLLYGAVTLATSVLGLVWWFAESWAVRVLILVAVLAASLGLLKLVGAVELKRTRAGVGVH